MIQSKRIEKDEEIYCSLKHQLPIENVAFNAELKKHQRLFCSECKKNYKGSNLQLRPLKEVVDNIEENQKQKKDQIEIVIACFVKLIQKLKNFLDELRQKVIAELNQFITIVDKFSQSIIEIGNKNVTYSFFEELENLINYNKSNEYNEQQLFDDIKINTLAQKQRIEQKLQQFKSFSEIQKCEEILKNLGNINEIQQNLRDQIQKKMIEVQFKLIDQPNDQNLYCNAIVFNKEGSIMVSNESQIVKIWNFSQGSIKLQKCYKQHSNSIYSLVYSKKTNNFISGCSYNEIICWKLINENDWISSTPYKQHTNIVECLILNKQEDQLISGGQDKKIIVWQVDFMKNNLTFLYLLENHKNSVKSLSLNQSETVLASCACEEFFIWKKSQEKWELTDKQRVESGKKIHFITDQQLLWVTSDKKINIVLVFELENGKYQQNQKKTIPLRQNNECDDNASFPIIYNKEKNVILIRHKYHIYLISPLNDGTFHIVAQLDCQTKEIYGTMTNNSQYLVFWNNKQLKYQQYEIIYK